MLELHWTIVGTPQCWSSTVVKTWITNSTINLLKILLMFHLHWSYAIYVSAIFNVQSHCWNPKPTKFHWISIFKAHYQNHNTHEAHWILKFKAHYWNHKTHKVSLKMETQSSPPKPQLRYQKTNWNPISFKLSSLPSSLPCLMFCIYQKLVLLQTFLTNEHLFQSPLQHT